MVSEGGEPLWQLNEKTPEPNQEEYTCRVIKAVEESKFLVDYKSFHSPPKKPQCSGIQEKL